MIKIVIVIVKFVEYWLSELLLIVLWAARMYDFLISLLYFTGEPFALHPTTAGRKPCIC